MEGRPIANPRGLKRLCLACGVRTRSMYQLCPTDYALYAPLPPIRRPSERQRGPADTKAQRDALVAEGVEAIMDRTRVTTGDHLP